MFQQISLLHDKGGAAMVAIGFLSLVTIALILWKLLHLRRLGVWHLPFARGTDLAERVVARVEAACQTLTRDDAEAEAELIATAAVAQTRHGLRALEVISVIAPLLGLLGTVLGMISAFQALQSAGSQVDPGVLAGGIWEALLTTAAGMAVAIPASLALAFFDSIAERRTLAIETAVTRLLIARDWHAHPAQLRRAG